MSLTEVEHVGYDRSSDYVDNSDLMDRVVSQGDAETEDNRQWGDEPGVGLGLPGLASLTLPSENMVVPPLNFARVSDGVFRSGYPIACNFRFLGRLGLRSILCLCPDSMLPGSLQWANDLGIRMETCDLGENSPPFVSMPLAAMRSAVDFVTGCYYRMGFHICIVGYVFGMPVSHCSGRRRGRVQSQEPRTPKNQSQHIATCYRSWKRIWPRSGTARPRKCLRSFDALLTKSKTSTEDRRNRPILVHCLNGRTQTGCAIGCLRRRQNWSLGAIFDEYTQFAGESAKPLDMQFMELFE
ncbi:unnamed protein product [Ascophyllum nodosum]